MPLVSIIDYKVGNIFSMENALKKVGFRVEVNSESDKILQSDAVVLPGVGNFRVASQKLAPLKIVLNDYVHSGRLLLGSCLGMQLLFQNSEEGVGEGLNLIEGCVKKFSSNVKTPHMGWNNIKIENYNELLDGLSENSYFYFVHSYYPLLKNGDDVAASTIYGEKFASIVSKNNIHGCQFHPEKSGKTGLRLLENFARMTRK